MFYNLKFNPYFRELISKQGLLPKGKGDAWLTATKIDGDVIFATNSDNPDDWFDSPYDDDIYRIDTKDLKNKWFKDPNFGSDDEENKHMTQTLMSTVNIKVIKEIKKYLIC